MDVAIGDEQKNRLAQRLAMTSQDRSDSGQLLEQTARAFALEVGSGDQLEALVHAFETERVIVPIRVEEDPRITGVHAGENGHDPTGFLRVDTAVGPAIAVFSSARALAAYDPQARPMGLKFVRVALVALVESAGRVLVDPGSRNILLPRAATSALAQGDHWLPAWRDEDLRAGLLEQAHATCEAISDLRVEYIGQGVCRIVVGIDSGSAINIERAALREMVQRVIELMNTSERLRAAADRVEWVPQWINGIKDGIVASTCE